MDKYTGLWKNCPRDEITTAGRVGQGAGLPDRATRRLIHKNMLQNITFQGRRLLLLEGFFKILKRKGVLLSCDSYQSIERRDEVTISVCVLLLCNPLALLGSDCR